MDMITNDHEGFDPFDHLTLALKALRNNRHFYVFGPFDVKRLHQCGPSCELIWDKGMMSGGNTALPWGPAHERITFGTRCRSKVNIAEGYGKGAVRMRRASVLRFDRPNAARPRNHLAEKPVALLRELIESSSRMGETVLDPFVRSGSTCLAAKLEGRRAHRHRDRRTLPDGLTEDEMAELRGRPGDQYLPHVPLAADGERTRHDQRRARCGERRTLPGDLVVALRQPAASRLALRFCQRQHVHDLVDAPLPPGDLSQQSHLSLLLRHKPGEHRPLVQRCVTDGVEVASQETPSVALLELRPHVLGADLIVGLDRRQHGLALEVLAAVEAVAEGGDDEPRRLGGGRALPPRTAGGAAPPPGGEPFQLVQELAHRERRLALPFHLSVDDGEAGAALDALRQVARLLKRLCRVDIPLHGDRRAGGPERL